MNTHDFSKLFLILIQVFKQTNVFFFAENDLSSVEVIIADIENVDSIRSMCERARIIINCVGPYRFFGEKIVKECLETGTHHVDISGEPEVRILSHFSMIRFHMH